MEIINEKRFKEILSESKLVLIDFYADWCGPCKMLAPIIEDIAKGNEEIKVVKVNVDDAQDLAVEYQIMSIPTIVIIKEGQETNRNIGIASKTDIMNMVK